MLFKASGSDQQHLSFLCDEILTSLCIIAVEALKAIKKSLIDPNKNLRNWNRGDPCMTNWTRVLCYNRTLDDGYLHVMELYGLIFRFFINGRHY